MTWHTATVPVEGLASLVARIRCAGGTIACSRPGAMGVRVTWTIAAADPTQLIASPTIAETE